MKSKKTLAMLLISVILLGMLTLSVYAATGSASASSTSAYASVDSGSPNITGYIEVYATLGDALKWVRDEYEGEASSASASVTDEGLGEVQSARARGWFNGDSVCEDYWSILAN